MRPIAIVVLGLSVAAAACNRNPGSSPAGPPLVSSEQPGSQGSTASEPRAGAGDAVSERSAESSDHGRGVASSPAADPNALNPMSKADHALAPPAYDEVTVPEGTVLTVRLDTAVASDRNRPEDAVRAHLTSPVRVGGRTVIPAGSELSGSVTAAERSGKVKGVARVAFRFHELTRAEDHERYRIDTSAVSRRARTTRKKDAVKIGGGALGGAVVGGLIGGKKGAAIGTAAGGGAGSAVVMSTRGEEVRLAKGATVTVKLASPLTIRIPRA